MASLTAAVTSLTSKSVLLVTAVLPTVTKLVVTLVISNSTVSSVKVVLSEALRVSMPESSIFLIASASVPLASFLTNWEITSEAFNSALTSASVFVISAILLISTFKANSRAETELCLVASVDTSVTKLVSIVVSNCAGATLLVAMLFERLLISFCWAAVSVLSASAEPV